MDRLALDVFRNLFCSIPEEMGACLVRSACSVNIKERRDASCALFDSRGAMVAQAEHIPVHLGSMPLSVRSALTLRFEDGDAVLLNDPFRGGTHLPDVTVVRPVFHRGRIVWFAAARAHFSDIGGAAPGSMPVATEIYPEGLVLPILKIRERGRMSAAAREILLANVRNPEEVEGDLQALLACCDVGALRLEAALARYGEAELRRRGRELIEYAERLMRRAIADLPSRPVRFEDALDDDGTGTRSVRIRCTIRRRGTDAVVDFSGSDPQTRGSVNAVYAVTLSATLYCFRCLVREEIPANDGCLRPLRVIAPEGTVVHARRPAATSAGNVETSQRIVDVVLGALSRALPGRIPAASCGTMSNFCFGGWDPRRGRPFAYYETIAGGMGARPGRDGEDAVQTHMTNTLNTPIEVLENEYPVRVREYRIRRGSGGRGRFRGGAGIVREFEFLHEATVSIVSDRRRTAPYGLRGGLPGSRGRNLRISRGGVRRLLPGKTTLRVRSGERVRIETPGGGGWGKPPPRVR